MGHTWVTGVRPPACGSSERSCGCWTGLAARWPGRTSDTRPAAPRCRCLRSPRCCRAPVCPAPPADPSPRPGRELPYRAAGHAAESVASRWLVPAGGTGREVVPPRWLRSSRTVSEFSATIRRLAAVFGGQAISPSSVCTSCRLMVSSRRSRSRSTSTDRLPRRGAGHATRSAATADTADRRGRRRGTRPTARRSTPPPRATRRLWGAADDFFGHPDVGDQHVRR